MILGLGVDLVSVPRIEKTWDLYKDRFLNRCFTEDEIRMCLARPHVAKALAMRFAAKEALSKACGLGMKGLGWREIEVRHNQQGKPFLAFYGRAKAWMEKNNVVSSHLSLSDDGEYAVACVVLEK